MTGVAVEQVFSVMEADPDWVWPPVGALGTGFRPPALPVEHGRSLVLTGVPAIAAGGRVVPAVALHGRAVRSRKGVSASRR